MSDVPTDTRAILSMAHMGPMAVQLIGPRIRVGRPAAYVRDKNFPGLSGRMLQPAALEPADDSCAAF